MFALFQEKQAFSSNVEQSKKKRKTCRQRKTEKIIKEAQRMYEIENQERKKQENGAPTKNQPTLFEEIVPKNDNNQVWIQTYNFNLFKSTCYLLLLLKK